MDGDRLISDAKGARWHVGSPAEVQWIADGTFSRQGITSAIPRGFEKYGTVVIPEGDTERFDADSGLLEHLAAMSGAPWWLGYLDTGAHDVVFHDAPKVGLYAGWMYVLVEAGAPEAGTWRADNPWRGRLPDLIFPADRAWLVSMLWDDDWRCLGGPADLINAVLADPRLDAREVGVDDPDATPPGFTTR